MRALQLVWLIVGIVVGAGAILLVLVLFQTGESAEEAFPTAGDVIGVAIGGGLGGALAYWRTS